MAIKLEGSAATCTVTFCLPLGIFGIQSCFIALLSMWGRKEGFTFIHTHKSSHRNL